MDSSVVIALLAESDPHHGAAVEAIKESSGSNFAISAITLAEVLMQPYRLGRGDEVAATINRFVGEVVPVSSEIAQDAAHLRASKDLGIADCIISATATEIGAVLWTFDKDLSKAHKSSVLLLDK